MKVFTLRSLEGFKRESLERRMVVAILAVAVSLSGCNAAVEAGEPSTQVAVTSSSIVVATSTAVVPDDVGAMVDRAVTTTLENLAVPGAVVLVRTPEFELLRSYGFRDAARRDLMTVDDHFRVGSTTKTMVGTVALQLVAEGKLSLDDTVSTFRSDIPRGAAITIAQLLEMRSGLYNFYDSPEFNAILDTDPARVWSAEELIHIGASGPSTFAPGTGFQYSNTNIVLLAAILGQVTGRDIGTLLRERIFEPLHMAATYFPAGTDNRLPDPFARGYFFGTNVENLSPPVLQPDDVPRARARTLLPNEETNLNPSWIGAAGGVISTARDLAAYVDKLVGGSLVPEPVQQQRLDSVEPVASTDFSVINYGLGLESFGPMLGHDGAIPGYQTFMGFDPKRRLTIVVLCNLRDGPAGGRPANQIAQAVSAELN